MKVIISGINGKMGKTLYKELKKSEHETICGIDVNIEKCDNIPVYNTFEDIKDIADVIIDFSSPLNIKNLLDFAVKKKIPAVICTTGYSKSDEQKIKEASKKTAIFLSSNMSIGISLLNSLSKESAEKLTGYDIEIIEKHHNEKKDAPSGTAITLANEIKNVCPEKFVIYGRNRKRTPNEICIHSVRGGNIVGEHQIMFIGENETLTLSHQITDRNVFAIGAIKAGEFLIAKKTGLYNMKDLLGYKKC